MRQYLAHSAQSSGTSGTLVRCPFVDDLALRCDVIVDPSIVDAFNAAAKEAKMGMYTMNKAAMSLPMLLPARPLLFEHRLPSVSHPRRCTGAAQLPF